MVTRGHSWSTPGLLVVIRGHSWSLVVTRGHLCVLLNTICILSSPIRDPARVNSIKQHGQKWRGSTSSNMHLRTVPPFVAVHMFCASQDIPVSYGICPPIQKYLCVVYDHVEKADLSKGYQNPKRKLGVIVHFSEIIELKF